MDDQWFLDQGWRLREGPQGSLHCKEWRHTDGRTYYRKYGTGFSFWCLDDQYHREDGPAIEFSDNSKMWYLYGERLPVKTQEEFERYLKMRAFW
jgi:hypothetical protein